MEPQDYPGLFQSADETATRQQRWHFGCLNVFLVVLLLGSLLSLFPSANKCAAVMAAVLFSSTIGLTLLMAYKRFDKSWYSARAVAESVKTRTWRYMMRAEPYEIEDIKARELFTQDLTCILKDNAEAIKIIPALNANAITGRMNTVRKLTLPEKRGFYKSYRVDNQLGWYIKQTAFNRKFNAIWFCLLVSFQIGALICVVVKLNYPSMQIIPTGLFTTLAGAALSWTQAKRFGELSTSYNLTAHEISIISGSYLELSQEQQFTAFVRDSEAAFSREHTQWIARRGI